MAAPETDPSLAPSYLTGLVAAPAADGPAALLVDGRWCGHGEPRYRVWDVPSPDGAGWRVATPVPPDDDPDDDDEDAEAGPSVVRLFGARTSVDVYDARRHPASGAFGTDARPAGTVPVECDCGGARFHVAIGFEVPSDATSVDDTSWVALAARCAQCREDALLYDDEIA